MDPSSHIPNLRDLSPIGGSDFAEADMGWQHLQRVERATTRILVPPKYDTIIVYPGYNVKTFLFIYCLWPPMLAGLPDTARDFGVRSSSSVQCLYTVRLPTSPSLINVIPASSDFISVLCISSRESHFPGRDNDGWWVGKVHFNRTYVTDFSLLFSIDILFCFI